jgi:hypothetical protein
MTLRKFDDATNEEIPLAGGVEVVVMLADGTSKLMHFATWAHVPPRLLDGTVAGQPVVSVLIRDLSVAPPAPLSVGARRAAVAAGEPATA